MGRKLEKHIQLPGKCLFCGGGPLSKEHIWSDWLKRILPRQPSRTEGYQSDVGPYTVKGYQGDVSTKKVRVVCRDCNSNWMSEIVNRAKVHVEHLVNGEASEMDSDAQNSLRIWVALSALMANRVTRAKHRLPDADIDYFYKNRAPPPHWFVGLGTFDGVPTTSFDHSHFAFLDAITDEPLIVSHAFCATIGKLFTLVSVDVGKPPLGYILPEPSLVFSPEVVSIVRPEGRHLFMPMTNPVMGPWHFFPGTHAMAVATRRTTLIEAQWRLFLANRGQ